MACMQLIYDYYHSSNIHTALVKDQHNTTATAVTTTTTATTTNNSSSTTAATAAAIDTNDYVTYNSVDDRHKIMFQTCSTQTQNG